MRAACAYCLVALVDRFLPINQGLARVIEATFREGSVVDPRFPAAVNTYMPTALTVAEAVLRALAPFVPDKRISGGSGSAALVLGGRHAASNRAYVHYEIFSGGTGARTGKDGVSATAFHLSNCKTAPIEIIESEFPTRVERFEMIPDSGGAGEWRGGLGFVRDYRILADEVRFSMRTDKHAIEPLAATAFTGGKEPASSIREQRGPPTVALRRPPAPKKLYRADRAPRRRRSRRSLEAPRGPGARRRAPGIRFGGGGARALRSRHPCPGRGAGPGRDRNQKFTRKKLKKSLAMPSGLCYTMRKSFHP